jgi:abortive infection bacteriophage resistance protein
LTIPFGKLATTYAQQVALLQSRGMTFADSAKAEFFIEQINYYRLTAYWLPFEVNHATHQFRPGTTFERVLAAYSADRELRLLFLDAIERVEVSVRAHWAFQMAHLHGPHSHLDRSLFRDQKVWLGDLGRLTNEVGRSKEVFIEHMRKTYEEFVPPVWAACEVMSLGLLSNWFANLGPMSTRKAIADAFLLDEATLASWLQHLNYVRNVCAHHSRLWNRSMTITPAIPRTKPTPLAGQFITGSANSRKLYNTALLTLHLTDVIAPRNSWRMRLRTLLLRGDLDTTHMGFPHDWQQLPIWL